MLVVRGGPALLVYRRTLPMRERIEMVLLTATALPLLVALAEIGVDSGVMLPQNAAALVGAGLDDATRAIPQPADLTPVRDTARTLLGIVETHLPAGDDSMLNQS